MKVKARTTLKARYCIVIEYDDKSESLGFGKYGNDASVARAVSMDVREYQRLMLENFNCYLNREIGELYFVEKNDTIDAINWIQSLLLMREISKV